jgi:hypothetical protein
MPRGELRGIRNGQLLMNALHLVKQGDHSSGIIDARLYGQTRRKPRGVTRGSIIAFIMSAMNTRPGRQNRPQPHIGRPHLLEKLSLSV